MQLVEGCDVLNFTTSAMAARGRAEEYAKTLGLYYTAIEPDRSVLAEIQEGDLLDARSTGFSLGNLSCSEHRCNSPFHRYSMRHRSPHTGYSLQLVKEGTLTITSDDNELHMKPGDIAFVRPMKVLEYHALNGGSRTIGIHVPLRLANPLRYGRRIALDRVFSRSSGIGACVASLVETITDRRQELTAADCASLQTVVAEAIIQLGTSTSEEVNSVSADLLESLKVVAVALLSDPDLTPARVAERAGISVRTLHRAFQASGETFWSWVRDRRLERCHIELAAPSFSRRSITEVALRWGFNDLSTFDRNFRKRYGVSPRMIRSATT